MNDLEEVQLFLDQLESLTRVFIHEQKYHLVEDLHAALHQLVETFGQHVNIELPRTTEEDIHLHHRCKTLIHTTTDTNTAPTDHQSSSPTITKDQLAQLQDIELYIADKLSQYGAAYHRDLFTPADPYNTGVIPMVDFCNILRRIGVYLTAQEREVLVKKFPPTDEQRASCVGHGVECDTSINYVLFLLYLQALNNTTTASQWAKRVPAEMANRSMVFAVHPELFTPSLPSDTVADATASLGGAHRRGSAVAPYLQVNAKELTSALQTLQSRQGSTRELYRQLKNISASSSTTSTPTPPQGIAVDTIVRELSRFGFPINELTCSTEALHDYIQLFSTDNQPFLTFAEFSSFIANDTPTRLRSTGGDGGDSLSVVDTDPTSSSSSPQQFPPSGPLVSPLHPPFHKAFQNVMRQVNSSPAREYFRRLDTDRDHFVSITHLINDFRDMGLPHELAASPHCYDFIAQYSKRLKGFLSFNEFIVFRDCVHVHTNRNYTKLHGDPLNPSAHHPHHHHQTRMHQTTIIDGMSLWQSILTIRAHLRANPHISLFDEINNVIPVGSNVITRKQFHVILSNAGIVVSQPQGDAIFTGLSPMQQRNEDAGDVDYQQEVEVLPRDELMTTIRAPEAHPYVLASKRSHQQQQQQQEQPTTSSSRFHHHHNTHQSDIAGGDVCIARLADAFHALAINDQYNPHSKRNNQQSEVFGSIDGDHASTLPHNKAKRPSRKSDIFEPFPEDPTTTATTAKTHRSDIPPPARIDFGGDHGGLTPLKPRKHYPLRDATFVMDTITHPQSGDDGDGDGDGDVGVGATNTTSNVPHEDIDSYYQRRRAMRSSAAGAGHAASKGMGDSNILTFTQDDDSDDDTSEGRDDGKGDGDHHVTRPHLKQIHGDSDVFTLQSQPVDHQPRAPHPFTKPSVVVGIPANVTFTPASKTAAAAKQRRKGYANHGTSAVLHPVDITHPQGYRSPLFIRRQYDMMESRGGIHHLDDDLQPAATPVIIKRQSRYTHLGSVDTKLSKYVNPGGLNLRRTGYDHPNNVQRLLDQSYNAEYQRDQSFVEVVNNALLSGNLGAFDDHVRARVHTTVLASQSMVATGGSGHPSHPSHPSHQSQLHDDIPKLSFDDDILHVPTTAPQDDADDEGGVDALNRSSVSIEVIDDEPEPDHPSSQLPEVEGGDQPQEQPQEHQETPSATSTPLPTLYRRVARAVYGIVGKTSRQVFNDWSNYTPSITQQQLLNGVNNHTPVAQHLTMSDVQALFTEINPANPSTITFSGFTRILSRGSD